MAKKKNNLKQYLTKKSLIFRRIFWVFKTIPYKFMFVLLLLSLWLGEWYPISNVPMYSTFSNSTNFIYVTDSRDKPIPLQLEFGFSAAFIKKVYNSRLKILSNQKNSNQNISRDLRESLKQLLTNNNINISIINQTIQELSKNIYQEEIQVEAGEKLLQYIVNERNPKVTNYTNYQKLKLWNVIVANYFTQQTIAAAYVVAGIMKLINPIPVWRMGIPIPAGWIRDLPFIAVGIIKTHSQQYYGTLSAESLERGNIIANWIVSHPNLTRIIFSGGLFLELFAFLLLLNRRWSFIIGISLILMHWGIFEIMQLKFDNNIYVLLIYTVNVPFLILSVNKLWQNNRKPNIVS